MDIAVKAAAAAYRSKGCQLLENTLAPLLSLAPEDFESGQYDLQGFGSTKVRMDLALARFRQSQGRAEEAKKFAAIGLATIGIAPELSEEHWRISVCRPNQALEATPESFALSSCCGSGAPQLHR